MLTSIVKATREHYAALQHRPGNGHVKVIYQVACNMTTLNHGTLWVTGASRTATRAAITRAESRLRAMYPEATSVEIWQTG